MAAPAARDLFHRAIGESGAYFTHGEESLVLQSHEESEARGLALAKALNAPSASGLRAASAADVLKAAGKFSDLYFAPNVDGNLLTTDVAATFASGRQSHVPLLAGWNADEARAGVVLARQKPTAKSFAEQLHTRFGASAESILTVYPAGSDAEALESAASLASDLFMGYPTWKWIETHTATGKCGRLPVLVRSQDSGRTRRTGRRRARDFVRHWRPSCRRHRVHVRDAERSASACALDAG